MEENDVKNKLQRLLAENTERMKELAAINRTTAIFKSGKSIQESLQQVCMILPSAYQYPAYTTARIKYEDKVYTTPGFEPSKWLQHQQFETIDGKTGTIEVFYTKEFIEMDEGPFLNEERFLIQNLAHIIIGFLNSIKAKELLSIHRREFYTSRVPASNECSISSMQLLQRFLNKNNKNRDVYHDLMPFKVKEILLIANLYDAYSIEKEGRFSEHVLGEYHQMNLSSLPRITGVSSEEEAMEQLHSKHFDLIIFMMGADVKTPVVMGTRIKSEFSYIPIHVLLNNNSNLAYFNKELKDVRSIDNVYVWNGDSRIFFAMIKGVEDRINVENDTQLGMVRVILMVEDSPQYYSRYIPMLYNIVMEQTRRIISDVTTDELYKVLRLRARPKILMAKNYEDAVDIIARYRDNLLCLISDVKFDKEGEHCSTAGFDLVDYARSLRPNLPIIIQSSNIDNSQKAYDLKASFIHKGAENLMQDFKSFITHYLGFGNFIYRDKHGHQIAIAKSMKEFEIHLRTIPDESLYYHANKNHFSLWLMARGEIQAAKILAPQKVEDFESIDDLRNYLISVIKEFRNEQNKGKIIPFEESAIQDETNIVSLVEGSLGGKGRGIAFVNSLIHNLDFSLQLPDINIKTPLTAVIGTDEFEFFIERNKLLDRIIQISDFEEIKQLFLECRLTETLERRLKILLKKFTKPIAIRSSGLFEDSLMQPFAGVFDTYILPNSHNDINIRTKQALDAIKLVYASVYSKLARDYIRAVNYRIEDERMAVIIQEVVGHQYGHYFYPHISGVAQSYNYYPFAHMKPEEGFAVTAVGLGKYVVEGEKAHRFSPKYPTLDINSPKDQFKNSQLEFYAVDLQRTQLDLTVGDTAGLARLDIDVAEKHGNLKHTASVYNIDNDTISAGTLKVGPRIINFANILKYNHIPLSKTINTVLDIMKQAVGTPVEIEFAVDLNKDEEGKASFHILQIKPLHGSSSTYEVNLDDVNKKDVLLLTEIGMGNGLIDGISDVVFVDKNLFEKSMTSEIAIEIEQMNNQLSKEGKNYILIGPGRWGTRDPWIGIPVNWPQISAAKIIIETSLQEFPLDASSGSHFFHNVTSMNVGYFSVQHSKKSDILDWDVLLQQRVVNQTKYVKHIRFDNPLTIKMDGKNGMYVITWKKLEDSKKTRTKQKIKHK
ncbi:MAG: pyruvate, phosphate dikinase [Bacteroidales bacterium]|nr:pyruvate, phosphate dikinase [Bacteroidales bacterium]